MTETKPQERNKFVKSPWQEELWKWREKNKQRHVKQGGELVAESFRRKQSVKLNGKWVKCKI